MRQISSRPIDNSTNPVNQWGFSIISVPNTSPPIPPFRGTRNKATASLTTPSKTHLFLHSCRLDLWEFPRFWTSGLKPLSSFFTQFAWRGNINPIFAGICIVLWSQDLCYFSRGSSRQSACLTRKTQACLFAQDAWHQACLCAQEKHSCVASRMCASSKDVNIPTPPHDWRSIKHVWQERHRHVYLHKMRGIKHACVHKKNTVA